jgi:hypothetical protein
MTFKTVVYNFEFLFIHELNVMSSILTFERDVSMVEKEYTPDLN